jgi:hypothetical protein
MTASSAALHRRVGSSTNVAISAQLAMGKAAGLKFTTQSCHDGVMPCTLYEGSPYAAQLLLMQRDASLLH